MTFRFTNPLREAMAKKKAIAFQDSAQILAAAAQFRPEALAEVDVSQMLRDALQGAGAPATWMKSDEVVAAEKAQMAQEQAMQKMAGMVGTGAQVAEQVGKAGVALNAAQNPDNGGAV